MATRRFWGKVTNRTKTQGKPVPDLPLSSSANSMKDKSITSDDDQKRGKTDTAQQPFLGGDTDDDPSSAQPPTEPLEDANAKRDLMDSEHTMKDLWGEAWESLQGDRDSEKKAIVEAYHEILLCEHTSAESGHHSQGSVCLNQERVAETLGRKVKELDSNRATVSFGSHELDVEALFDKTTKNIMAAKDLITAAASVDPHASLVCAGGLVLLTFLVRPIEQREKFLKALELTSSLVCKYIAMEQVYRRRAKMESLPAASAKKLVLDLENSLISLYANIIEFQARATCHLHRSKATQFIRDMFRGDTWKDLITEIKDMDDRCRAYATLITDEKLHAFLDEQRELVLRGHEVKDEGAVPPHLQQRRNNLLLRLSECACPYQDRKDINNQRTPGTCEWFTGHPHFRSWEDSPEPGLLWVSADPGCGKSVLSKYLVDVVLPRRQDRTLCYFFFKDGFDDQKTASGAMCAILRQLLEQHPDLMDEALIDKFYKDGEPLTRSFKRLFEIFLDLSSGCKKDVVCVLDALDECGDEDGVKETENRRDRRQIMTTLSAVYKKPPASLKVRFIITSRPYLDIKRAFQGLENNSPAIHLRGEDEAQVKRISSEIDVFIRQRVEELAETLSLEPGEAKFLETKLIAAQNRTYLWVKLALDVVESILSFTKENVEAALSSIPEGLDRLYENILSRSHDTDMARKIIHIVLAARKPMSVDDMSVALAIKDAHRNLSELQLEARSRFVNTLKVTCGLFVSIIDDQIYFLHQTAREFLLEGKEGDARAAQQE
ncbi:hypothetical protein EsH8_VII_000164 [Colletotrichum jinshuiense]